MRKTWAFSLIEVTVAIGLLSFCLAALLGLFCMGLKSSQGAGNDTALSAMASYMAAEITSQKNFAFAQTSYFDHEGCATTNAARAFFACTVVTNAVPASELSGVSATLRRAALTFTWPQPRPVQTQAFYVTFQP